MGFEVHASVERLLSFRIVQASVSQAEIGDDCNANRSGWQCGKRQEGLFDSVIRLVS